MKEDERPSKRNAFLAFLHAGWVSVHVDARRTGVLVPPPFTEEPRLVLQYGRNMPVAIPDLEVTEEGISATLSFSRTPYRTHVPWSAVYAVACTDGRGVLYQEDLPEEVAKSGPAAGPENERRRAPGRGARRSALRSVPADSVMPPEIATDIETASALVASSPPARRRRRPQLRLVK